MNKLANGSFQLRSGNGTMNGSGNGFKAMVESIDSIDRKLMDSTDDIFTFETINAIANSIRLDGFTPDVGIICGTGLGLLGDKINVLKRLPFEDIPNFTKPTVAGHAGEVIFGELGGLNVVCMKGRFHYYEGYSIKKCAMPVRVMKVLGIRFLIVTNAAGGLSERYRVGDVVLMKNHISMMGLAGNGPLVGPNENVFGERFPPMKYPYDRQMIKLGRAVAKEIGINNKVHEGVYTCVGGPNYETLSEIKFLRTIGVDTVGMSSVHEAITAIHCGIKVFAFSLVTNICLDEDSEEDEVGHAAVMEVGNKNSVDLSRFVQRYCEKLKVELDNDRI